MSEMVRHMMKRSDNHFAEQLYVAVSHARMGRGGYSESQKIEGEFLRRIGMPLSGFRGEDGSGLSELNRITAREMVHVLEAMLGHPAGRAFVDSMAISGRDGTLRSRMRDSVAMDRVRAKTGFISGVSCLSGYMTVQEFRQPLVFAMLFNQLNGGPGGARATQDRICEMVIKAYQ
jgi:D-alanyl-D-alanine carboxypeptidase/D-alanyl-D-alanine-endopeptidase (penicillin-binding protein 4)